MELALLNWESPAEEFYYRYQTQKKVCFTSFLLFVSKPILKRAARNVYTGTTSDDCRSGLTLHSATTCHAACTLLPVSTVIIIREFWMTLCLLWICVMSEEMARLIRVVEMLRSCQILSLPWSTVNLPFIAEPSGHFLKWYRGSFLGLWQPARDLTTRLHWWVENLLLLRL